MTDRELIKLAAKAAGYTIHENGKDINGATWYWCEQIADCWSPLTDDGDALRLAVEMKIEVFPQVYGVMRCDTRNRHGSYCTEQAFDNNEDIYAATRRAIVRAAAAIGETK